MVKLQKNGWIYIAGVVPLGLFHEALKAELGSSWMLVAGILYLICLRLLADVFDETKDLKLWKKILISGWLLTALCSGFFFQTGRDGDIVVLYTMVFLGFPSVWLFYSGLGVVIIYMLPTFPDSFPMSIIFWLSGILVGYLQWFVLVPKLILHFKKARE